MAGPLPSGNDSSGVAPGCSANVTSSAMPQVRRQVKGCSGCAAQADLLLHGDHGVDVPLVRPALYKAEGGQQNDDRDAVVQRFAAGASLGHLFGAAADRGEISDRNCSGEFAGGQATSMNSCFCVKGFSRSSGGEDMGGTAGDQPGQVLPSMDCNLLGGQSSEIDAADCGEAKKTAVQLGYDQADFVHVRGQHDPPCRRTLTLLQADEIAHCVDVHLIDEGRQMRGDRGANGLLPSADAGRLAQFFEEVEEFGFRGVGVIGHYPEGTIVGPH